MREEPVRPIGMSAGKMYEKPLVYTGENFYNNYLVGELDGYKLMIARYSAKEPVLKDGRDIYAWQYTGKGSLEGVVGYVDKSRLMGRHSHREKRFRKYQIPI